MALLFRPCVNKNSINGIFNRLCKIPKHSNVQIAHISGKINRQGQYRHPPYPYKKKSIGLINGIFDYGIKRFDENTRLLVVEGPIASGKDKFARELAMQLDMAYMPPPSFDLFYKTVDFDMRSIDHLLPETAQTCDIQKFLCNPHHKNVAACQTTQLLLKVNAYAETMLHILSTGEGVVMNRCVYSDYIFMLAMLNAGYVRRRYLNYYKDAVHDLTRHFMRPHLVIYLDVPVNVVQENIKKRCIPYEVNSKVLTKEYLTDIEDLYKNNYLPSIEEHAYVLMYDWSCGGEIEDVVEDIERLNLDYDERTPEKLEDWTITNNDLLNEMRMFLDRDNRDKILSNCYQTKYVDMSELYLLGADLEKYDEVLEKCHDKYSVGFNPDHGDKVLWKSADDPDLIYPDVITNQELVAASKIQA